MRDPRHAAGFSPAMENAAAAWVLREDAGLTLEEEQQLADWLAADPRHTACLEEHRRAWQRFAPLAAAATATELPPVRATPRFRSWLLPLAAAAAIAIGGIGFWRLAGPMPEARPAGRAVAAAKTPLPAPCAQQLLPDGTVVELNRGAEIEIDFAGRDRRVRLVRGEASFAVAKDPTRPFIVAAGTVQVRAVGTAFNVRFGAQAVEVVVTEGRVSVETPAGAAPASTGAAVAASPTLLSRGQSTVVALTSAAPSTPVATLTAEQLAEKLAWQPRLLEFDDAALATVVAEFNRRNPVRLTLTDPALGAVRLSLSFRSDNVEGFVRLLEANYGVKVEPRGPGEIGLRR